MKGSAWVLGLILFVFVIGLQSWFYFAAPAQHSFSKYAGAARQYTEHTLEPERVPEFSPFYFDLSLILARTSSNNFQIMMILQILAAAAFIGFFAIVCSTFFSRAAALLASIMLAASPSFVVMTRTNEPEIWLVLWIILSVFFLVRYLDERRLIDGILSGLFLGLAVATRPSALILAPFYLVSLWLNNRQDALKSSLAILIVLALFVGGLYVRNRIYTGIWSVVVMDAGVVFYESNNPQSQGSVVDPPLIKEIEAEHSGQPDYAHVLWKHFPSLISGRKLDAQQGNAYWIGKAITFLRLHPKAFLQLILTKIRLLPRSEELYDIWAARSLELKIREAGFLFFPFGLMAAAAIPGILLEWKRWRRLVVFYGGVIGFSLFSLIFYASARQRMPLLCFLSFFAAACLHFLIVSIRSKQVLRACAVVMAIVILKLGIDSPFGAALDQQRTLDRIQQGLEFQTQAARLRNQNRRNEAADAVVQSIAAAPYLQEFRILANLPYGNPLARAADKFREQMDLSDPSQSMFDLGVLLVDQGRFQEAEPIFQSLDQTGRKFFRFGACSPEPAYYLGRIAQAARKQSDVQISWYTKALDSTPGDPESLAAIVATLEKSGDQRSRVYREQLFSYYDDIDCLLFLGIANYHAGRFEEAVQDLRKVLDSLPEWRRGRFYLAAALGKKGDLEEAMTQYRQATAHRLDPLILEEPILEIFWRYVSQHPQSSEAYSSLGVVLREYGRFDEAIAAQRQALQLNPTDPLAQSELGKILSVQASR